MSRGGPPRRDSFFRGLRGLEKGDTVRIRTTNASFSYVVESIQVVEPEALTPVAPTGEAVATLITCFPFNYVGPAPRRFVARARLMEGTSHHSR
jgi:sortase A